jgi:hypothetical protein
LCADAPISHGWRLSENRAKSKIVICGADTKPSIHWLITVQSLLRGFSEMLSVAGSIVGVLLLIGSCRPVLAVENPVKTA